MAPIRKAGKLPRPAASVDYALEYGTAEIEMSDDLEPGTRVLLVDDILATGGTLRAGQQLLDELGLQLAGTAVLMELVELQGRACAARSIPSSGSKSGRRPTSASATAAEPGAPGRMIRPSRHRARSGR
jgi:adenine phosphoribosyltransferase